MSLQFHRYKALKNRVLYPLRNPRPKGIPTVYQQAEEIGGTFTRITKGLPEDSVANFSPSLIKHRGSTLVAWRSQPQHFCFRHDHKYFYYKSEPTSIYVGQMFNDEEIVNVKKLWNKPHRLSQEDPRLFIAPDDTLHCQFVTSSYASLWDTSKHKMVNQPKVCVGGVNIKGELEDTVFPAIGDNLEEGKPEKNWCFFSEGENLRLLYSTIPIVIKQPGKADTVIDSAPIQELTGGQPTFNSTAPILVDDEWMVFFHWKYMVQQLDRRPYLLYSLGAYTLDKDFTKVLRVSTEPLFTGSVNDELITWTDCVGNDISNQPACILPFGCYEEDGELVMSLGVNDSFMGIFRCDMANIFGLLRMV